MIFNFFPLFLFVLRVLVGLVRTQQWGWEGSSHPRIAFCTVSKSKNYTQCWWANKRFPLKHKRKWKKCSQGHGYKWVWLDDCIEPGVILSDTCQHRPSLFLPGSLSFPSLGMKYLNCSLTICLVCVPVCLCLMGGISKLLLEIISGLQKSCTES